jgi:hypothetical protein
MFGRLSQIKMHRSLETGRRAAALLLLSLGIACASRGSSPVIDDSREPLPPGGVAWPVRTAEHIDLWLHAFAMLQQDTARVPYFRRGYREDMEALKRARNITTRLDQNHEMLADRFAVNRSIANAQFLGIYFANWDETKEFMRYFLLSQGDPQRSSNATVRRAISIIGGYFRTPADREWARVFMQSLEDEYEKFYHSWWTEETTRRRAVFAAVDSLWQNVHYPRFKRYLDGSQQRRGDIFLSLPLNGEGRLIPGSATSPGGNYSYLAVSFPDGATSAVDAVFVVVHEVSGRVVTVAVNDHTTPAETRDGLKARYEADGLVVGGYLLMKRVAPELAEDFARYYLRAAQVTPGSEGVEAALMKTFPLPQLIRESIVRQIDIVMSGI